MQTLKNYFKHLKLQNCIDDVLAIKELHFVKDLYFQNIITLVKSIENNKNQDFLKIFSQLFSKHSLNQKQTLKLLMILHEILRQTDSYETSDSIIEVLFYQCKSLKEISDKEVSKIDSYLKRCFCIPYTTYLIKAFKKESKQKFDSQKQKDKRLVPEKKETIIINKKQNNLEGYQIDFRIFNLITDIFKLNADLHQMGRYYSDHQYVINIYLEMLKDFEIYFRRIQASFVKLTNLRKEEVTQEEAQKIYLYLSESERCVSKMNSFYYNKYLYYYVNDKISLKMQLEIPQPFYKVLNKSHKEKKLTFDYCLTATHPTHKYRLPDTRDSNRSKPNNFSKIVQSIASLNETLEQMQSMQKIQIEKENLQNLRKSALF